MVEIRFDFVVTDPSEIAKAFSNIAKSADKASRQASRAVETEGRKQAKVHEKVAREAEKAAQRAASSAAKEEAKKTKAVEKESAKRGKAAEKEAERIQRAQAKARASFHAGVGSALGTVAKGAAYLGGAALGVGAAFLGTSGREAFRDDEKARRLAINAGRRDSKNEVRGIANSIAEANSVTTDSVLEGLGKYIEKTGKYDAGVALIDTITKASLASGADSSVIASMAGDLTNNLGITNVADMQKALADQIAQGRSEFGQISLEDLGRNMGKASGAASAFDANQFSGYQGSAKLGGLVQLARRSTGSAEQATESVSSVFEQLQSNADVLLKRGGVDVRNKQGKTRDINDIIVDSLKIGGSNFTKKNDVLSQVYGSQGMRALNPLKATYEGTFNAERAAGKSEKEALAAAEKAVREELTKSQASIGSWDETVKDAATAQDSASSQLTQAWERLKNAVGDSLLGAIEANAGSIGAMADNLLPMIEPAIGLMVAGFDLAATALADFVEDLYSVLKPLGITNNRVDTIALFRQSIESRKTIRTLDNDIVEAKKKGFSPAHINMLENLKTAEKYKLERKEEAITDGREHNRKVNTNTMETVKDMGLNALYSGINPGGAVINSIFDVGKAFAKNDIEQQDKAAYDAKHGVDPDGKVKASANSTSEALNALNAEIKSLDLGRLKPVFEGNTKF